MSFLWHWITQHQALAAYASLWLYSALVVTMPEPTAQSSVAYLWLFRLLHLIASNLDKTVRKYSEPSAEGGKSA